MPTFRSATARLTALRLQLVRMLARRAGIALVALVAVAGAVAAMGVHAWRAERAREATAARMMHDYAAMAAWELASNMRQASWLAMTELLRPVESLSGRRAELPASPAILAASRERVRHCACAAEIPALYYFRVDLPSGALTVDSAAPPDSTVLPTSAEERWLSDTVTQHARSVFDPTWRVATIVGNPERHARTVAYALVRDSAGRPVAAYGVVSATSEFVTAFALSLAHASLLPPALARQARVDTLVSILVRDEIGRVVYRSPWQFGGTSVSYPLSGALAGFTAEATLRSDVAPRLLPPGSSGSLPMLAALFALATLLVLLAWLQFRREAKLTALRADFVSSVSHELRTPLTQIRMFAELLRLGWTRDEGDRTRALGIIEQEARRLGFLVDRVLAFERSERGGALTTTATVPLAPIVRDVVQGFAPIAQSRGVEIDVALDDRVMGDVDSDAIRQVILNLLDNAVKYGPVAQTVTVALRASDEHAVILIDDEGPGVPSDSREAVFESFHRLPSAATSAIAGSGLGLALVRRLVTAHRGRVTIEEGPRGGARVRVELPRAIAPVAPPAPEVAAPRRDIFA